MLIKFNENYDELKYFVVQTMPIGLFYSNIVAYKNEYFIVSSAENNCTFWYLFRITNENIQLLQKTSISYHSSRIGMTIRNNEMISFIDNRWYLFYIDDLFVNNLEGLNDMIAGIAKTSGQAGELVKVITPKYLNESEEN